VHKAFFSEQILRSGSYGNQQQNKNAPIHAWLGLMLFNYERKIARSVIIEKNI